MAATFGIDERSICGLFTIGSSFTYKSETYKITCSGKPTCSSGEPKTDIYVSAYDKSNNVREFKISFKKQNADFLENKISKERAEQLFGADWSINILSATKNIINDFNERPLIYLDDYGRVHAGSFILGWKFELVNKTGGQLSGILPLSQKQVIDVYAGTNLSQDKRNAKVNGIEIADSGVANFILFERTPIRNLQDAIDSLLTIEEYVAQNPHVYFACKALSYRSFEDKYDGNRPLSVYVEWSAHDGKLKGDLHFDEPLLKGGDYAVSTLITAFKSLAISTTEDLSTDNVYDCSIVYGTLPHGSKESISVKHDVTSKIPPISATRTTAATIYDNTPECKSQGFHKDIPERSHPQSYEDTTSPKVSPDDKVPISSNVSSSTQSSSTKKEISDTCSVIGIIIGSKVLSWKYGVGVIVGFAGDYVRVLFDTKEQPISFEYAKAFGCGIIKKI